MRQVPLRVAFVGGTDPRFAGLLAGFSPAVQPLVFGGWDEVSSSQERFDLVVRLPGAPAAPGSSAPYLPLDGSEVAAGASVVENRLLSEARPRGPEAQLLGTSPQMLRLRGDLVTMAKTTLPLLLGGESGTGKDLAASVTHALSPRSSGPFVAVNCGAVPANLAETEFFGSVRGAFTGAENRTGYCQQAMGGTLFLDEVAELPLEIQAILLRVLENRELRRVGSPRLETTEFRLVCATHRDLSAEVAAGRFREDLFYRVNVLALRLPALRERKEDIPLLARHFLKLEAGALGRTVHPGSAALARLTEYHWPGNLRQLRNVLLRAAVLEGRSELSAKHLQWDA